MDPLTAFSLVAGIIQVVQFSSSVISTAQQICQGGSTKQNVQIELITKDFRSWNDRIKTWNSLDIHNSTPLSEKDQVWHCCIAFTHFEAWLIRVVARRPQTRKRTHCRRALKCPFNGTSRRRGDQVQERSESSDGNMAKEQD